MSLKNCTELAELDVSENELVGNFPTWIGEKFSSMRILNFRLNKFQGFLPVELCRLASLQILDLAYNNFFGTIPRRISNFSAMVTADNLIDTSIQYSGDIGVFFENGLLVMKGKVVEYNTVLRLVRSIHLSKNKLSGAIPLEVKNLKALQSLNLSFNHFTGKIPDNIGAIKSLKSIDFSTNRLYGKIPRSMSSLTFFIFLNLANNNLNGKIPFGTQLQSYNVSCYMGNELCGSPLPNCTIVGTELDFESGENDFHEHKVDWFYVSMALGFVVGFWSIIHPLIANRRWRHKYCQFLDRLGDKFVYVARKYI